VCGAQRSQIQFEDENHAIYMSFRWVTTTCLRREPQPVTLWLYPVIIVTFVSGWVEIHSAWPHGRFEMSSEHLNNFIFNQTSL